MRINNIMYYYIIWITNPYNNLCCSELVYIRRLAGVHLLIKYIILFNKLYSSNIDLEHALYYCYSLYVRLKKVNC